MRLRPNADIKPGGRVGRRNLIAYGQSLVLFVGAIGTLQIASAQNVTPVQVVAPEIDTPITEARRQAHKMFQRLTRTKVQIDDPRVKQMETLISQNQTAEAAKVATSDPLFLDVGIRDWARVISSRDRDIRTPMNDFVATVIGVVRDSDTTSAKELLTGNFTYRVNPEVIAGGVNIRQDELNDLIASNNHYSDLQARRLSPSAVLVRQSPQRVVMRNANNTPVDHPDPAGLLTSRQFQMMYTTAGTNRLAIEYSFKTFMCVSMEEWMDSSRGDDRVGRDVSRMPAGDLNTYQTTCKGCHAQMDAYRGAFAYVDFLNNRPTVNVTPVGKMNPNNPENTDFTHTDNSFRNYAFGAKNADQFGWRTGGEGVGMGDYGRALADSRGFSRCMVRHAFQNVCNRKPRAEEETMVRTIADQFEMSGYHMKRLFENVAARPECI